MKIEVKNMRKCVIAGNWKMNGSIASVDSLVVDIRNGIAKISNKNLEWIIFPPFVYLDQVNRLLDGTNGLAVGAQNLCKETSGAFTGEISANMLKEFHCQYVLVGHSERRTLYNESDDLIAAKFIAAAKAGLKPILCIGETLAERNNGKAEDVIQRQLNAVIQAAKDVSLFQHALIAYEPVWAIGTGVNASPEEAEAMHLYIRQKFAKYDANLAENLQILYGGSLKPDNAKALLAMPNIDGGLIGGASLKANDFLDIGRVCNR
jgi:triosephosphate isomerase (TIM)